MSPSDHELLSSTPIILVQEQVHVWPMDLTSPAIARGNFYNILDPAEQQRADRFHFSHDRARFIAARGALRSLLARYLNLMPGELQFSYGAQGKPSLVQAPQLHFNLSHANTKALLAVTLVGPVGIDIEYTAKELDLDGIASRFFSTQEYSILQSLPPIQQRAAFFTAWVRKEAFLKALGQGLVYGLEKVVVTFLPTQLPEIIAIHDHEQRVADWALFSLATAADYAAALVVKNADSHLQIITLG